MVTIAVTSEPADEPRVAVSPDTVKKFSGLGAVVRIEQGAGLRSRFSDDAYRAAGAEIVTRPEALTGADILLAVRRPSVSDVAGLKPGAIVAGMVDPFGDRAGLDALAGTAATVFFDGVHAADDAGAVDGRAVEPGESRWLQGRRRCCLDVRTGAAADDDAGRYGSCREGLYHGRRRRGFAGHCDGAPVLARR